MRVRQLLAAALAVGVFATIQLGQERYVRPTDEARLDPSFLSFRTRLIAAAERRDTSFILGILDPKIELTFGGLQGIKDFKEMWEIDKPHSKFWDEFLPVIKNGGKFVTESGRRTNQFIAPYTFASFPDLDAYDHFIIFGSDVNLRERPDPKAGLVGKLSYNIVQIEEEIVRKENPEQNPEQPDWYKITTLGGKRGYVKAEYVRSPIDYRAGFEKKRGQWKMTFFIGGD